MGFLDPEPTPPPHTPCLRPAIDFDPSANDIPLPVTPPPTGTASSFSDEELCCLALRNDLTVRLDQTEKALVVQKHESQKTIDKLEVLIEDLSKDLNTANVRFQRKQDRNAVLEMEIRRAAQEKIDAEERERVTELALKSNRAEVTVIQSVLDAQQKMLREDTITNEKLASQLNTSFSKIKKLETSLAEAISSRESFLKELKGCRDICQHLRRERNSIRHWVERTMELKARDDADCMLLYDHLEDRSIFGTREDNTMWSPNHSSLVAQNIISSLDPKQTTAKTLEVASVMVPKHVSTYPSRSMVAPAANAQSLTFNTSSSPISKPPYKENALHKTKFPFDSSDELTTTKVFRASFLDRYDNMQVPQSALDIRNLKPLSSNLIKALEYRPGVDKTPAEVIGILEETFKTLDALARSQGQGRNRLTRSKAPEWDYSDDMRSADELVQPLTRLVKSEVRAHGKSLSSNTTKPFLKLRIPGVAQTGKDKICSRDVSVGQGPITPYTAQCQPIETSSGEDTLSSARSSNVAYHTDKMRVKRRGASVSTTPETTPEFGHQTSVSPPTHCPRLLHGMLDNDGPRRWTWSTSTPDSLLASISCEDEGASNNASERVIQTTTNLSRPTHGDGVLQTLGTLFLHIESAILALILVAFLVTRPVSNSFDGYGVARHLPENVTVLQATVDTVRTVPKLAHSTMKTPGKKTFVANNPVTLMNTSKLLLCEAANKSSNVPQIQPQYTNPIDGASFGDSQMIATTRLQDLQRMVKPVVETQYITVYADGASPPMISCPPMPLPLPLPPPVECPQPVACPVQNQVSPVSCPCLEIVGPKKPFDPTAKYRRPKLETYFPGHSGTKPSVSKVNMTSMGHHHPQDFTSFSPFLPDPATPGSESPSSSPPSYNRPPRGTSKRHVTTWGDHLRPGYWGPLPFIQQALGLIRAKLL